MEINNSYQQVVSVCEPPKLWKRSKRVEQTNSASAGGDPHPPRDLSISNTTIQSHRK
jgi:hypothetical protein